MPITLAPVGESVPILGIIGRDSVRLHLASMGFVINQPVTIVNRIGENVILQVKESRIALSKSLAERILV